MKLKRRILAFVVLGKPLRCLSSCILLIVRLGGRRESGIRSEVCWQAGMAPLTYLARLSRAAMLSPEPTQTQENISVGTANQRVVYFEAAGVTTFPLTEPSGILG